MAFKEDVIKIIKEYNKSGSFTDRKLTDTPTDGLSSVPRKYVTRNGASTVRPKTSVLGEQFFDTTLGHPIYWDNTSWVDSQGSVV